MVPAVRAAKAGPQRYAKMPATIVTSRNVGTTLNTMLLRMKLMPAPGSDPPQQMLAKAQTVCL